MKNGCENTEFITQQKRREYRDAMKQMIEEKGDKEGWDAFITLNFNCATTLNSANKKLQHFLAKLDYELIGRHWLKKTGDRTEMMFFPEHIDSNFHFHGLGKLPPKASEMPDEEIALLINTIWKGILRAGTTDFQYNTFNKHVLPGYVTKGLARHGGIDNYILSSVFWSEK